MNFPFLYFPTSVDGLFSGVCREHQENRLLAHKRKSAAHSWRWSANRVHEIVPFCALRPAFSSFVDLV
jgi:hypothetical protein